MKNVLVHMSSCKIGKGCEEPHCSTSRTIMNHWNGCINVECPICQRLKRLPDCNQTEIAFPKVCTYLVYSFIYLLTKYKDCSIRILFQVVPNFDSLAACPLLLSRSMVLTASFGPRKPRIGVALLL